MSRSRGPSIAVLLFAVLSVPLSGCDLHDKAWDAPAASATQSPAVTPGSPPPVGTGEIVITVGANGGVACSLDGVAVPPLSPDAIVRSDTGAGSAHLLIVDNSARDTEVCFPISVDLDALDISGSGRNAIRHLGHSLIVETEGASRITLSPRDSQNDIDDCVQFAGEDNIEGLAARLTADSSLMDGRDSRHGQTAVARAAEMGRTGVVAYLVGRKANVEIRDERGFTPLHLAVSAGRIAIVRLLVNAGADVNAISSSGPTPLALALKNGHREIAAFLSGAGAKGELPASTSPPSATTAPGSGPIFELADTREHGPFPDGSEIRRRGRVLYVLRGGQSDRSDWEQYDLPVKRDTWTTLQDTNFRVMVRGKRTARVWADYHAGEVGRRP